MAMGPTWRRRGARLAGAAGRQLAVDEDLQVAGLVVAREGHGAEHLDRHDRGRGVEIHAEGAEGHPWRMSVECTANVSTSVPTVL